MWCKQLKSRLCDRNIGGIVKARIRHVKDMLYWFSYRVEDIMQNKQKNLEDHQEGIKVNGYESHRPDSPDGFTEGDTDENEDAVKNPVNSDISFHAAKRSYKDIYPSEI